jgi:hypothetical protein
MVSEKTTPIQMAEIWRMFNLPAFTVYVDYEKAFNRLE